MPHPRTAPDAPLQLKRCGLALLLALLAACGTTRRDGPEVKPPSDLQRVPDAVPQVEPIRSGGPNQPYAIGGRSYTPLAEDKPLFEKGLASWYGKQFQGKRTASGETYNMYAMTAAHKTMPLPSYARVRNPANGREVIVRVNDRGPFHPGRVIDLSYTAALKLGVLGGVARVEIERITPEQIRKGSWRRDSDAGAPADASVPVAEVKPALVAVPVPVSAPADLPPAVAAAALPEIAMASASARAFTADAQGFWVQLGAFRQREGAEQFQRRVSDELDWLAPLLAVFSEPSIYRLQAGPYPTRTEAQDAGARVRDALKLVPVIVERR